MTFHVGQKVVCVDDSGSIYPVIKSQVYTISDMSQGSGLDLRTKEIRYGAGVRVEEIPMHEFDWFAAERFRPVKTTSIEIFRAMLVTPPKVRTPA